MKSITTTSPAKLNLFLHITGKRDDGYHNLQTVFRLLDWGDDMRFEVSEDLVKDGKSPVRLHCSIQITDDPNDNLIIKSAYALLDFVDSSNIDKDKTDKPLPIIDIYLDKEIPTGAGLGGGSSNSATTLMALNQLWELALTSEQLQEIGAKIGANVPFFIYASFIDAKGEGCSAISEGIGEVFTPINLPKQQFLLLTQSAHISTAELFSHPNLTCNVDTLTTDRISKESGQFLDQLNKPYHNVFESVVTELSEEVAEALSYLQQFEPLTNTTARMTGSGGCVFLPVPYDTLESMLDFWLEHSPCDAIIVKSQ